MPKQEGIDIIALGEYYTEIDVRPLMFRNDAFAQVLFEAAIAVVV